MKTIHDTIIFMVTKDGEPFSPPAFYREWAVLNHLGREKYDGLILSNKEWLKDKKMGFKITKYTATPA